MKMSAKVCICVALVFASVSLTQAANVLTFQPFNYAGSSYNFIYNRDGGSTKVLSSEGWTYKLYRDISGNGPNAIGVDEAELGTYTAWSGVRDGWFFSSITEPAAPASGDKVFVRVFDPDGYYFNLTANAGSNGSVVNGSYSVQYVPDMDAAYFNGTPADGSGWISMAVPEPGTLALMGLGAMVIGLRKRRQARKG